jgi:prephenate dehydrogenase
VHFRKITIVGVGLLGGSLGMAIRKKRMAAEVAGYVRRQSSIRECRKRGAVDVATRNLREAVAGADLIVLCTPLGQMAALTKRMLPAIKRGAILTDVGSVKADVSRELERLARKAGAHFIGSHPMAGSEATGVAAARPDLFVDAVCVLTPTRSSDPAALGKVQRFWKALGARVLKMPAEQHDLLVSRSSHLPHFAAVTLTNLVLHPGLPKIQAALCANGFRDSTRIASGSPQMWRDIALANRKYVDRMVAGFILDLQQFRRVLRTGDSKMILQILRQAKARRDLWRAGGNSRSSE